MQVDVRIYQDEDGVWIATVPSMPGTVSQGKTERQALNNIKDAIQGVLSVRREAGWPLTSRVVTLDIVG